MAKIKAPLFSLDAAGSVGKEITYAVKKGNKIGLKYSEPGDKVPFESSPRQKDQRSIIGLITAHWQCMSPEEKLSWEIEAKTKRFKGTGYHYFLHLAKTDLTKYLGLVCFWTVNYNVNNTVIDLSGKENKGYLRPVYPGNCPVLVDSFDKKHGKAVYFDGINDYLVANPSSSLTLNDTDGLTVEMWFKSPLELRIVPNSGFVIHFFTYLQKGFFVNILNGKQHISIHGGAMTYGIYGNELIEKNKWYLLTLTHKNRYTSLYINGKIDNKATTVIMGTTSNLPFSISVLTEGFKGYIDNVRVYNRAILLEEIKRHYDLLI